ncbi:unnamed protein product [Rangifer tarandus platyrhynchus]|uniref:Uncharacterized protein n=2 Tax=Rangifer tarandus platyrhynchus TaxID=3082113 RepID=A0ABN8ZP08_RANTA|nr:unnamed protein product [Rangifer tarandus platyrhynchus]
MASEECQVGVMPVDLLRISDDGFSTFPRAGTGLGFPGFLRFRGLRGWCPHSKPSSANHGKTEKRPRNHRCIPEHTQVEAETPPSDSGASHVGLVAKNPPAKVGDIETQVRSLG